MPGLVDRGPQDIDLLLRIPLRPAGETRVSPGVDSAFNERLHSTDVPGMPAFVLGSYKATGDR